LATLIPDPRILLASLAVVLLLSAPDARATAWEQIQAQLLSQAGEAAGSLGVEVIALPSGHPLWSHRAMEPMIPASLLKAATSYAALKTLGPGHRFRTTAQTNGTMEGSTLVGDLWLKSEGDIFWTAERASSLALQLKAKGLESIRGRIRVDNSHFSPPFERVCLDEPCEDSYNPMISGTAIEFNSFLARVRPASSVGNPPRVEWLPPGAYARVLQQARTASRKSRSTLVLERLEPDTLGVMRLQLSGQIPISRTVAMERRFSAERPATFVAEVFTTIIESSGIRVEARTPDGKAPESMPADARILAEDLSPPLAETIHGLNRHSNNFMAEMLLRAMGAAALGPPGTEAKGLAVMSKVMTALGAETEHCVLKTGSGLSRSCRMSPRSLGRILVAAFSDRALGAAFMNSLAVNGQEGTMRRRISSPSVTIRGKTGTLRDVTGFAGYVSSPGRPSYAVVILFNDVHHLGRAREAMDSFLEKLALAGPPP
jgi:D-alanyl-D-alanine carboxypeptidase/D-alanyl-D-alanine-endopeptidase (penicillin-binding protein 4)